MEVTIDLDDEDRLTLDTVDIDVHGEALSFQIEGKITGLDASILETIANKSLQLASVTFVTTRQ